MSSLPKEQQTNTPPPPNLFWRNNPLLVPGKKAATFPYQKTVLMIVRSPTTLERSVELAQHLFKDIRIQTFFTVPDNRSSFGNDLELRIHQKHLPFIPWQQARATSFDLGIIASSIDDFPELDMPLLLISHGPGATSNRSLHGVNNAHSDISTASISKHSRTICLVSEDERALYSSHRDLITIGDPVFDSLFLSIHHRQEFRNALQAETRKIIVVSSTWNLNSSVASHPQFINELLQRLPQDEYIIAAILHPNIWVGHGEWQIYTWLHDAIDAGLRLIPYDGGWQATIVAADYVLGDNGSVSIYANELGIPTGLISYSPDENLDQRGVIRKLANTTRINTIDGVLDFISDESNHDVHLDEHHIRARAATDFANLGNSMSAFAQLAYSKLGLTPPQPVLEGLQLKPPQVQIIQPLSNWCTFHQKTEQPTFFSIIRTPATVGPQIPQNRSSILIADIKEHNYRLLQNASGIILHSYDDLSYWHCIGNAHSFAYLPQANKHKAGVLTHNDGSLWNIQIDEPSTDKLAQITAMSIHSITNCIPRATYLLHQHAFLVTLENSSIIIHSATHQ